MLTSLVALIVGLVFGLGLILSGMANPAKVLAFLDVSGAWDPSLAFVMVGAIATAFIPFRLAARRTSSLSGQPMRLPRQGQIDRSLIAGSMLFGVGWGLAGICPGPGIVLLGYGAPKGVVFVAVVCVTMFIFQRAQRWHRLS